MYFDEDDASRRIVARINNKGYHLEGCSRLPSVDRWERCNPRARRREDSVARRRRRATSNNHTNQERDMGNQSAQNSRIKSRLHQYFFKRSYNHAWIFTYSSFNFLEAHRPKLFGFYLFLPYAVPIVCSGNLKKADGGIYFDIYLQNQTCIIFWLSSQNVKIPKTQSPQVSNSKI